MIGIIKCMPNVALVNKNENTNMPNSKEFTRWIKCYNY